MAEYIEREPMIEEMQGLIDNVSRNFTNATSIELEVIKGRYEAVIEYIKEQPTADVKLVIETEDLATATEQFICKNCGIRIENFDKTVLEEDNDGYIDKLFYEYRFKFCPECGAKVRY